MKPLTNSAGPSVTQPPLLMVRSPPKRHCRILFLIAHRCCRIFKHVPCDQRIAFSHILQPSSRPALFSATAEQIRQDQRNRRGNQTVTTVSVGTGVRLCGLIRRANTQANVCTQSYVVGFHLAVVLDALRWPTSEQFSEFPDLVLSPRSVRHCHIVIFCEHLLRRGTVRRMSAPSSKCIRRA